MEQLSAGPTLTGSTDRVLPVNGKCHKCGVNDHKYWHNNLVWCRHCLDVEEYPQFADKTPEEFEELRQNILKKVKPRDKINFGSF